MLLFAFQSGSQFSPPAIRYLSFRTIVDIFNIMWCPAAVGAYFETIIFIDSALAGA